MVKDDPEVRVYLPETYYQKTKPDRTFLMTIVNTVHQGFLPSLFAGAYEKRHGKQKLAESQQNIEATDNWIAQLNELPFISKVNKIINLIILLLQRPGKTVHLLKSGSKNSRSGVKRVKYDPCGTLDDYKKQKLENMQIQ